jgi:hypothetical protein
VCDDDRGLAGRVGEPFECLFHVPCTLRTTADAVPDGGDKASVVESVQPFSQRRERPFGACEAAHQ